MKPLKIHAGAVLLLLAAVVVVPSPWNNNLLSGVHGFARHAVSTTATSSLSLQQPWSAKSRPNLMTLQQALSEESGTEKNFNEDNDDDDDDGWGNDETTLSLSNKSQLQELQALQQRPKSATSTSNKNVTKETPERDLFIPIFALVSLAGLFGAYGYEMLRLYSRGELYLPWNQ